MKNLACIKILNFLKKKNEINVIISFFLKMKKKDQIKRNHVQDKK